MITVTVFSPDLTSQDHDYYFSHSAVSWLLLSGFLPVEGNEHKYVQPYTGAVAYIKVSK